MPELLGHHALKKKLIAEITTPRHHHAWLLYGPKGIGKALVALNMAQTFLCKKTSAPCGQCHSCSLVSAGHHPDLRILRREEGKRDIPVQTVREALAFLSLTGHESARRAIVIDDAEHMNRAAANALLKGLEEPPGQTLIVLVCGNIHRVLLTIRSRCVLQPCKALAETETKMLLERMDIAKDALPLALHLAQGRPGKVSCLREEEWCHRLLGWQREIGNPASCDIGAVQDLCRGKWPSQPLELAAEIAVEAVQSHMTKLSFSAGEKALHICRQLAELPARVERQSLNGELALLGSAIELRRIFIAKR